MLNKIMCNPIHPLHCALPVLYLPVRVTRGALVAHRYTYALSRSRTWQYCMTFISLPISLRNDLGDPAFDDVGLSGFKSMANVFLFAKLFAPFFFLLFSLSLL